MKKIILLIEVIVMSLFYSIQTYQYEPVTTVTQAATNFLQPRPGSTKSSQTLTLNQLNNFTLHVRNFLETAHDKFYDIDYEGLDVTLTEIEEAIKNLKSTEFSSNYAIYYTMYEKLFDIYGKSIESPVIDGRGFWHRPYETNMNQIIQTLEELSNMNINMLFIETFWLGRLIYESSIPDTFQHSFTKVEGYGEYGTNLLLAFVEEAKAYNIEVHAWVENFYVGNGSTYKDSPILNILPEWASINYNYTIPQRSEVNYLFMDPANPEVRQYLKNIYIEIVSFADVGSIHLDYIRYPVAKDITSTNPNINRDTGYSEYAEAEFKILNNIQGDLRTLVVTNPQIASLWRAYKVSVITDFVRGVYYSIKNVNPNIGLSTAIFGNTSSAINEKAQDWKTWIDEGLVEIITPMTYYQSALTVANETSRLVGIVGGNAFSYTGLAPTYMGFNSYNDTLQIQAALQSNAQGTVIFATQFYLQSRNDYAPNQQLYPLEVQRILNEGVYRSDSVRPHDDANVVIEAQLLNMLDKAQRIYVIRGTLSQNQWNDIKDVFENIMSLNIQNKEDLVDAIKMIQDFNPNNYVTGATRFRMFEDRDFLIQVLELRLNRINIDEGIDISINPDSGLTPLGTTLEVPTNFQLNENTISWNNVSFSTRYEVIQENASGLISTLTRETSIALDNLLPGTYHFRVRAVGDGYFYVNSPFTQNLTITILEKQLNTPSNIQIEEGILSFLPVENASQYKIQIDFSEFFITTTSFNLNTFNLSPGFYEITVQAIGNGFAITNSEISEVFIFKVEKEKTAIELEVLNFKEFVIIPLFQLRLKDE